MAEDPAPPPPPSRRDVVMGVAAGVGLATVAGLWFEGFGDVRRRRRIEPTRAGAPLRALPPRRAETLAAAFDRLLPSGGPASPGARDVNALGYFDALFAEEELGPDAQASILRGAHRLDRIAEARHRARFHALGPQAQDALIRSFEEDLDGVRWLRLVLEFLLECMFGDPVHGGNPREIGWKWIRHRPGTPRPTVPGWTLEEQP